MNVNYIFSLLSVIVLFLMAYVGVEMAGFQVLFGIIVPYLAMVTFIAGFIYRVINWAHSPVPFRIPTTCGQQKSLSWIKPAAIDNPSTTVGVVVRMFFEVLFFRSLFRNTRFQLKGGGKISYEWEKWLWIGAIVFHWSFLTVVIRHFRFFIDPVPSCLQLLEKVDGFLQIGLPGVLFSGIALLAAVTFLFLRRVFIPPGQVYFPCFRLFPPFSHYRCCDIRDSHAVLYKSGCYRG